MSSTSSSQNNATAQQSSTTSLVLGKDDKKHVVLITGCSSGIGLATAIHLAQNKNYVVYASARKVDTLNAAVQAGCKAISIDVNNEESMQSAIKTITEQDGGVDILINNAGYSQSGALEEVSIDKVRRQFETNVFGLLRMSQLVLPYMRARRFGKIINVGSMGGKLVFPGGGAYHATKYAVEALSDAMRFEVKGFGIDVVLLEPGLIKTGFSDAVSSHMPSNTDPNSPYAAFNEAVNRSSHDAYEKGPLAKLASTGEDVAKSIAKILQSKRPKARYVVSPSAHVLLSQRAMMTDGMWDAFLRTQFPQPGADA